MLHFLDKSNVEFPVRRAVVKIFYTCRDGVATRQRRQESQGWPIGNRPRNLSCGAPSREPAVHPPPQAAAADVHWYALRPGTQDSRRSAAGGRARLRRTLLETIPKPVYYGFCIVGDTSTWRRQVESSRGSCGRVCRSESDWPGTSRANPASARRPSGGVSGPVFGHSSFSPRRCGGCAVYVLRRPRPPCLSDCHRPCHRQRCCGEAGVGSGRSTTTASMVVSSSLQSGTLAPSITTPKGPPCSSTNRLVLVPGLPRSVGFLPTLFPPEASLAQPSVGALPVPGDAA